MKNRKEFAVVMGLAVFMGLTACAGKTEAAGGIEAVQVEEVSLPEETPVSDEAAAQKEQDVEAAQHEDDAASSSEETDADKDASGTDTTDAETDAALEAELVRYRQERDDNIYEKDGLIFGSSPDERNYTLLGNLSENPYLHERIGSLEQQEHEAAFETARIYVTKTLGINPPTKSEVYMCSDPRIWEIFGDEDKGVAEGYENENIFVCEYCQEDGVWQYLILVRDSKDSAWRVIHHGSTYKSE